MRRILARYFEVEIYNCGRGQKESTLARNEFGSRDAFTHGMYLATCSIHFPKPFQRLLMSHRRVAQLIGRFSRAFRRRLLDGKSFVVSTAIIQSFAPRIPIKMREHRKNARWDRFEYGRPLIVPTGTM